MEQALSAIEVSRASGKIRKGVNEVTKAVERQKAKAVFIASDINPKELVMHLPILCEEKGISCHQDVGSREELGAAAGIQRPTVCVAITDAGDAKDQLSSLGPKPEPVQEAPAAEEAPAEEAKEEAPAEEPKAEE